MEYYRAHSEKLDAMEKTEFIGVINANFKFDTKILLSRTFAVFDKDKDGFISRGVGDGDECVSVGKGEGADQVLLHGL